MRDPWHLVWKGFWQRRDIARCTQLDQRLLAASNDRPRHLQRRQQQMPGGLYIGRGSAKDFTPMGCQNRFGERF
jgi:hypothetical protein